MKNMFKTTTLLALAVLTTGCISITPTRQADTRWDAPFEPTPLYGSPYLQCSEDKVRVKFALSDDGKFVVVPDLSSANNDFFCDEYEVKGNR